MIPESEIRELCMRLLRGEIDLPSFCNNNKSIIRIFLHILGFFSFYANNFINKSLSYLYFNIKKSESKAANWIQ